MVLFRVASLKTVTKEHLDITQLVKVFYSTEPNPIARDLHPLNLT